MLLFTFVSIPAMYLLLIDKVSYKRIFNLFLGLLVSSLLTLLFWSISTLFQPLSATLLNNILKVLLSSTFPTLLLCLLFFLTNVREMRVKLPSFSFVTGFLYWNLIFSILLNTRRDSDLATLILPIMFMIFLLTFYYLNRVVFKKRDRLYRAILYISMPILFIFTKVFSYYSMIALTVLFLILIALIFTIKSKFKILFNSLLSIR